MIVLIYNDPWESSSRKVVFNALFSIEKPSYIQAKIAVSARLVKNNWQGWCHAIIRTNTGILLIWNKFQWIINWISYTFSLKNEFGNVVCLMQATFLDLNVLGIMMTRVFFKCSNHVFRLIVEKS